MAEESQQLDYSAPPLTHREAKPSKPRVRIVSPRSEQYLPPKDYTITQSTPRNVDAFNSNSIISRKRPQSATVRKDSDSQSNGRNEVIDIKIGLSRSGSLHAKEEITPSQPSRNTNADTPKRVRPQSARGVRPSSNIYSNDLKPKTGICPEETRSYISEAINVAKSNSIEFRGGAARSNSSPLLVGNGKEYSQQKLSKEAIQLKTTNATFRSFLNEKKVSSSKSSKSFKSHPSNCKHDSRMYNHIRLNGPSPAHLSKSGSVPAKSNSQKGGTDILKTGLNISPMTLNEQEKKEVPKEIINQDGMSAPQDDETRRDEDKFTSKRIQEFLSSYNMRQYKVEPKTTVEFSANHPSVVLDGKSHADKDKFLASYTPVSERPQQSGGKPKRPQSARVPSVSRLSSAKASSESHEATNPSTEHDLKDNGCNTTSSLRRSSSNKPYFIRANNNRPQSARPRRPQSAQCRPKRSMYPEKPEASTHPKQSKFTENTSARNPFASDIPNVNEAKQTNDIPTSRIPQKYHIFKSGNAFLDKLGNTSATSEQAKKVFPLPRPNGSKEELNFTKQVFENWIEDFDKDKRTEGGMPVTAQGRSEREQSKSGVYRCILFEIARQVHKESKDRGKFMAYLLEKLEESFNEFASAAHLSAKQKTEEIASLKKEIKASEETREAELEAIRVRVNRRECQLMSHIEQLKSCLEGNFVYDTLRQNTKTKICSHFEKEKAFGEPQGDTMKTSSDSNTVINFLKERTQLKNELVQKYVDKLENKNLIQYDDNLYLKKQLEHLHSLLVDEESKVTQLKKEQEALSKALTTTKAKSTQPKGNKSTDNSLENTRKLELISKLRSGNFEVGKKMLVPFKVQGVSSVLKDVQLGEFKVKEKNMTYEEIQREVLDNEIDRLSYSLEECILHNSPVNEFIHFALRHPLIRNIPHDIPSRFFFKRSATDGKMIGSEKRGRKSPEWMCERIYMIYDMLFDVSTESVDKTGSSKKIFLGTHTLCTKIYTQQLYLFGDTNDAISSLLDFVTYFYPWYSENGQTNDLPDFSLLDKWIWIFAAICEGKYSWTSVKTLLHVLKSVNRICLANNDSYGLQISATGYPQWLTWASAKQVLQLAFPRANDETKSFLVASMTKASLHIAELASDISGSYGSHSQKIAFSDLLILILNHLVIEEHALDEKLLKMAGMDPKSTAKEQRCTFARFQELVSWADPCFCKTDIPRLFLHGITKESRAHKNRQYPTPAVWKQFMSAQKMQPLEELTSSVGLSAETVICLINGNTRFHGTGHDSMYQIENICCLRSTPSLYDNLFKIIETVWESKLKEVLDAVIFDDHCKHLKRSNTGPFQYRTESLCDILGQRKSQLLTRRAEFANELNNKTNFFRTKAAFELMLAELIQYYKAMEFGAYVKGASKSTIEEATKFEVALGYAAALGFSKDVYRFPPPLAKTNSPGDLLQKELQAAGSE
eukprot:Nk52_evm3s2604 gene=Nk52_evmTU3s2604